jgi:hypothetical protein
MRQLFKEKVKETLKLKYKVFFVNFDKLFSIMLFFYTLSRYGINLNNYYFSIKKR